MKIRLLAPLLVLVSGLFAADPAPAPDAAAEMAKIKKLVADLKYHEGNVTIGDGLAKVSLPAQFRYLDTKDTETVLTRLWGNPNGGDTLGAVVPADFDPLGGGNWIVVITYDEDGYVKDDDAATINYTKMLSEMQESTRESSKERVKQGYGAVELVGWAKPPRYDAAAHKLYWAKELKFGDEKDHTLNYNIRMLGRRGVLVLNAVATMPELAAVEAATPTILSMVNFQEGHRYADYNADTDKVATYGLAALVAGGIAAKTGLLKMLWLGILAFKKVIIIALIALAGSFKKIIAWIRGRKSEDTASAPTPPPAGA